MLLLLPDTGPASIFFTLVASFSLIPLMKKDFLLAPALILTIFWFGAAMSCLPSFYRGSDFKQMNRFLPRQLPANKSLLAFLSWNRVFAIFIATATVLMSLHMLLAPPRTLLWLHEYLNCALSCICFSVALIGATAYQLTLQENRPHLRFKKIDS